MNLSNLFRTKLIRRISLVLLGAGLQFVNSAPAQDPAPPAAPAAASAAASPKTTLADFAWLAGKWRGELNGRQSETIWMPPNGRVMMGMFRLTEAEKTLVIELFTVIETAAGIEFRFRHFSPQLETWEKESPLLLNLAGFDGKQFAFENPSGNLPKRTFITRIGDDSYRVRSELIRDNGQMDIIEFPLQRVK
jgi:hypothetical protein